MTACLWDMSPRVSIAIDISVIDYENPKIRPVNPVSGRILKKARYPGVRQLSKVVDQDPVVKSENS